MTEQFLVSFALAVKQPYSGVEMTPNLAFVMPGGSELLIILFVLILLFGAKKLPELAKGIGRSMGEFKKAKQDFEGEVERGEHEADKKAPSTRTDEKPAGKSSS